MICTSSGFGAQAGAERQPLHRAVALQLSGLPPRPPHPAKPPVLILSFESPGPPVPLADVNVLGGISFHSHGLLLKYLLQG